MQSLSKFFLILAVFGLQAASAQGHPQDIMHPKIPAIRHGDILRVPADPCEMDGISEADGFMFLCSQVYVCSDQKNYVFKYRMMTPNHQGEETHIRAFCSQENSSTYQSCADEPGNSKANSCWNEAIDKGILRNKKKLSVETGKSIGCEEPDIADAGLHLSVKQTDSSLYNYELSSNSYSGPRTISKKQVQVTVEEKGQQSCTLLVSAATEGQTNFGIRFENAGQSGELISTEAAVPAMNCHIDANLYRELCGPSVDRIELAPRKATNGGQVFR